MMRRWGCYGACLTGAALLALSGCVPARQLAKGPESQEAPPAASTGGKKESSPPPHPAPQPSGYRVSGDDPLVQARIELFERMKVEWYRTGDQLAGLKAQDAWPDSWQECLQDIEQALTGYRGLQAGKEPGLEPWVIVGRDLHYFEKGCDKVLTLARAKVGARQEGSVAAPEQTEEVPPAEAETAPLAGGDQVRQLFEAGQYQEAVTAYETLRQGQPGEKLPRETREFCSRALVRLGRFPEAASLLTELLQEGGPGLDLAAMESRLLTADVLLAAGQSNEARQVYEGVAKALATAVSQQAWATAHAQAFAEQLSDDDLSLYQELIQAYLRFDGQQVPQPLVDGVGRLQGRTPGPLLDLARMLLTKATAQAQEWARAQLAEVRALLDRRELGRARELVDRVAATAPAEMREAIAALQVELAQAEKAAATTPLPGAGEAGVDPWAEALHLFELKQYDEAISSLQNLVDGEHGAEARAKMAEAAELAAAAMRQQAAALYAKARKTFDPEAKRQALQDSRALLLQLMEKYPEASVVAKARQNLKVLDGELGTTGPAAPATPVPAEPGPASHEEASE